MSQSVVIILIITNVSVLWSTLSTILFNQMLHSYDIKQSGLYTKIAQKRVINGIVTKNKQTTQPFLKLYGQFSTPDKISGGTTLNLTPVYSPTKLDSFVLLLSVETRFSISNNL